MSSIAQLRKEIIEKGDWNRYFSEKLEVEISADSDGWSQRVLCKFHQDTRPSLSVNIKSGGFRCHACPTDMRGSPFDFHCYIHGRDPKDKTNFFWAFVELGNFAGIDMTGFVSNTGDYQSATLPSGVAAVEPKIDIPKVNKADRADASQVPLGLDVVKKYHGELRAEHFEYLSRERGLTLATITKRLIGYDIRAGFATEAGEVGRGKFTIPVFAKDGLVRNIRKYSRLAKPEQKMMNTKPYGSPPRLYLLHDLIVKDWKKVVFCEGEFDAILLNQKFEEAGLGDLWGAVTGTHGCGTFLPEWLDYLWDKEVYFCYDCDDNGKVAMADICTKHFLPFIKQGKFKCVKIIKLPLEGTKADKDITDYFVKNQRTVEELIGIFQATDALESGGMNNDEATSKPLELEHFGEAIMNRRYIDKRVRVPLAISGQTNKVYHATREYQVVYCPVKDKENCCSHELGSRILPYGHELFIQSCMASKMGIQKALACIACTAAQKCRVETTKKVVMQEFFAHQVILRWRAEENERGEMENNQELIIAPIYVLQPEAGMSVQPANYMATGWVRTHPGTQQATLFVETLEPMEKEWQKYKVDNGNRLHLAKLKRLGLGEILEQIEKNVTRIYESDEILMTILLTYLSPLRFRFDGELIRGWLNTCVIGDSGTGKSATYSRLSDWLELGDLFSVLTGGRTGFLYALKTKGEEWYIQVGRYVTASRMILAVDETQQMSKDEIGEMTLAMDTGELDIARVAQGKYITETRCIFLMNPPFDKKISDYPYGCMALKDCFLPRFIRRLDLVVFCTANDNHDFYNQENKKTEELPPEADRVMPADFRSLVYWAWTRRSNNIIFPQETVTACLELTKVLSEKYGHPDDIPLVDPMGYRKELARLAVAYAVLRCNFTEDMESVTVLPEHVKDMADFVDSVYSSSSCNLLQHSKSKRKRQQLNTEEFDKIKTRFNCLIENARKSTNQEYADSNYFGQLLLLLQQQQDGVRIRDLKEQLGGISMRWLNRHLVVLRAFNMVEINNSMYKTTQKFNKFMLGWTQDTNVERMMETIYDKIGNKAFTSDNSEDVRPAFGRPNFYEEAESNQDSGRPF